MESAPGFRFARRFRYAKALVGALAILGMAVIASGAHAASTIPDKLPVPNGPACHFPVTGLIANEWMRIGGPAGPIGCPTGAFHADSAGAGAQRFHHGEIAIAPRVWEKGVVAAWQNGNDIAVDWTVSWTEPSHFNYDKFLVRWDFNGRHSDSGDTCSKADLPGDGDQCDVIDDMTRVQKVLLHYYHDTHLRTNGTWSFRANHGGGRYTISVEGCDVPSIGKSKCRQGWMHPVSVEFHPTNGDSTDYPIDLRGIPSAATLPQSRGAMFRRAAGFVLWNACKLLPHNMYRNEEDSTNTVLVKLAYVDFFQQDRCPGRDVANRPEAIGWLARQRVESKTGTTIDSCPGCRTGEYDVALSGLIPMVFRYGRILPPPVRAHISNDLLTRRGPLDNGDLFVGPASETENHLNMLESSRYLTNDLLFAATHRSEYDNSHNGLGTWWLKRLQTYLTTDFIEYNARPYQEYTMRGLQNMASFAADKNVHTAAQMVLEYLSAKLAVSSNDLRRVVPYRRKSEYNDPLLLAWHADPQSGRLAALAGNIGIFAEGPRRDLWGAAYGGGMGETAALTSYRISDAILDLIVRQSHRVFYQGIHHYADELYASEPSFLVSAGGHYASFAYKVIAFGKHDDIGNALPTTLMPTGRFVSRDDLIRFAGAADDVKRSNMCVAPGFACGLNPVVPAAMLPKGPGCVDRGHHNWTFIDFSPRCGGKAPFGMFIAVYQRGSVRLLEAFDTYVNPKIAFGEFVAGVVPRNDSKVFALTGANRYTTTIGTEVTFTISPDSRIKGIANGPPVPSEADFGSGTIIASKGRSGVVSITNPFLGQTVVLDDHDALHPSLHYAKVAPLAAESCRAGFVWREANAADHVCVPAATRTLAAQQNRLGPGRRAGGGAGNADACKQGFIWRQADTADHVCVTPGEHKQVEFDNRLAASRRAVPPG